MSDLPSPNSSPGTEDHRDKSPAPEVKDHSVESDLTEKEDETYITGVRLFVVVGSLTLCIFLMLLDLSILSTATPKITSDFQSLPDVGWYASAYQLTSAAAQPLTGKLYTHFQAKWTFLVFLFVFEVGSLICGVATSSTMLIIGRAVAGLGSAGLMNGGITILSGASPLEKRPLLTGITIGIGQIGVIVGPLVGGALTEYVTWRWCFFLNLPLGGVTAIILALIQIPDITIKEPFNLKTVQKVIPELDLIGFCMVAPAAIMLLLALQFAADHSHAWNSPIIIGLFCGAGAMAIVFVFWEHRRGDRAMIPGSIFRDRIALASYGMTLCFGICMYVAINFLPIYFQAVKGASPTMSGVYLLPTILSQLLMVIVSGVAVSKLGYYLPWPVFGFIALAISCGLMSTFSPSTETAKWVGYQILQGAGRGASMQMGMVAIQNALPPKLIALALTFQIFIQNLSASIFVVVATTIFSESLIADITKNVPSVSPEAVLAAGGSANGVRALAPPGSPELEGILTAYSNGIDKLFYMLAAFAALGVFASLGMGWKDVRKRSDDKAASSEIEKGLQRAEV